MRVWRGGGPEGQRLLEEASQRTLWQALSQVADAHPDKTALVGANDAGEVGRLTYRQLTDRIRDFSTGLAITGFRRGDRVVLWMTNSLDWVVAAQAAMRLGAAVVPVNTFLKPPEIRYVIEQSGARHLIMLDSFRKLDFPAMLAEICPAFGTAEQPGNLLEPGLPDLRHVLMLSRFGRKHPGTHDFATIEAAGRGDDGYWRGIADTMASAVQPGDLGLVKYTSGSTGFPKGVMLEQGGIAASGVIHARRVQFGKDDIFFSMMPFFHGGGSIWGQMTTLMNGGTLVFTEAFDPALAVRLIDEEKPSFMFGVLSNEVVELAREQGKVFPSVRTAPVPPDGFDVLPNVNFNILPFGLTETYGPAAVASPDDPPEKVGKSGTLLDGNLMRVVDPVTLRDVGPDEVGEAWLKGNCMKGYWNKPVETADMFTEDGWMRSQDLVSVDADGYISYVGRIKLMLKVGGENVSIEEVENVVETHDDVAECIAVGVPDERRVEVVRIYLTRRKSRSLEEDQLRPWLEARLARFKQPRDIIFVDELPHLANGKKDRVTVQNWAQEEQAA